MGVNDDIVIPAWGRSSTPGSLAYHFVSKRSFPLFGFCLAAKARKCSISDKSLRGEDTHSGLSHLSLRF